MDSALIPASPASFKYFYTDPLAAAWMAKHFKMRFVDRVGHSVSVDPALWYMAERHYQASSLHIHPDSLHLLEPQVGDMIFTAQPGVRGLVETVRGRKIGIGTSYKYFFQVTILVRNGKAFMSPEREAI